MAAVFAQLKCQIFISSGGGGGIIKFTLQYILWWWQYVSNEAQIPLSRIRLGWLVITRSIQGFFLLGSKFVGSEITWDKPTVVSSCSISLPSGVESPSGHQNLEWALKSPVKNVVKGFSNLIFACKLLKLDKKVWKLGELWSKAGLWYKTVKNIFFYQISVQPLWIRQRTNHFR